MSESESGAATAPPPMEANRFGPRHAALTLCFGVALIVGGVEAWVSWFADDAAVEDASVDVSSPHSSIDLKTPYGVQVEELILLAVLTALRLWISRRKDAVLFEPVLDLPLIGVALAASGGGFSPLAPALPLAYVTLIILLRSEDAEPRPRSSFVARLVIGFLAVGAMTSYHDRSRLGSTREQQPERFVEYVGKLHERYDGRIRRVEKDLEVGIGAQQDMASIPDALLQLEGPVLAARDALVEFLNGLTTCRVLSDLEGLLERQHEGEISCVGRWKGAFAEWRRWQDSSAASNLGRDLVRTADAVVATWIDERELFASIEFHGSRLAEETKGAEGYLRILERHALTSDVRRTIQIPAMLFFALLVMALADRLRRDARRAQLEQSRAARDAQREEHQRELERGEREKQNWIALTAGLTHGLGNDILAYDIYLREIIEEVGDEGRDDGLIERLSFLRDSNRGRMSFLQFLEAFAAQRKAKGEGQQPSFPHQNVELEALLHRVRSHLAAVETADLPPRGVDPAVDRQLDRLQLLPLQVEVAEPSAGTLREAHRGVIDFCVYELLKNALRNCSGRRPLEAHLRREGDAVRLRLINDVEVEEATGRCGVCGKVGRSLRRVRRRREQPATCEECFPDMLQSLLDSSFEPGKGGGSGLGLFLIRYFLSTYYGGGIQTEVIDAAIPLVQFELHLPDDQASIGPPTEEPGPTGRWK